MPRKDKKNRKHQGQKSKRDTQRAARPLEIVQIDATPMDILLVDEMQSKKFYGQDEFFPGGQSQEAVMDKSNQRQTIKRRILKMINQDGITLTEVSRSSGIPIATLVYWQSQAEQNSAESS